VYQDDRITPWTGLSAGVGSGRDAGRSLATPRRARGDRNPSTYRASADLAPTLGAWHASCSLSLCRVVALSRCARFDSARDSGHVRSPVPNPPEKNFQ
ncbi:MAG: hypothetical protein AAEJ52_17455, partial [Myxococcota bacterium]